MKGPGDTFDVSWSCDGSLLSACFSSGSLVVQDAKSFHKHVIISSPVSTQADFSDNTAVTPAAAAVMEPEVKMEEQVTQGVVSDGSIKPSEDAMVIDDESTPVIKVGSSIHTESIPATVVENENLMVVENLSTAIEPSTSVPPPSTETGGDSTM